MAKIVLTIEADGPADLQHALRGLANGVTDITGPAPGPEAEADATAPKTTRSRAKATEPPATEATTAPQATGTGTAPAADAGTATTTQGSATAASPASSEPAASSPATSSGTTGVTMDSCKAALTAAIGRVGAARCQEALKTAANGQTSLTTISQQNPELLPTVEAALNALTA